MSKNLIQIKRINTQDLCHSSGTKPGYGQSTCTGIQYNRNDLFTIMQRVYHNNSLRILPPETVNNIIKCKLYQRKKRGKEAEKKQA